MKKMGSLMLISIKSTSHTYQSLKRDLKSQINKEKNRWKYSSAKGKSLGCITTDMKLPTSMSQHQDYNIFIFHMKFQCLFHSCAKRELEWRRKLHISVNSTTKFLLTVSLMESVRLIAVIGKQPKPSKVNLPRT